MAPLAEGDLCKECGEGNLARAYPHAWTYRVRLRGGRFGLFAFSGQPLVAFACPRCGHVAFRVDS